MRIRLNTGSKRVGIRLIVLRFLLANNGVHFGVIRRRKIREELLTSIEHQPKT